MNAPPTDTRARIIAEAERLFRHYGYSKTTIGDISEACGMSPANIYRFFPSKSALIQAICQQITYGLECRLLAIVRAETTAAERLTQLIKEVYQYTLENYLDHRKVHEMVLVAMEEQWLTLREHINRMTAFIAEIIASGVASGEFPPCDVARTAKSAHAAIVTFCHPGLVAVKLDDEERATTDEIATFVVNALKAGGCPAQQGQI